MTRAEQLARMAKRSQEKLDDAKRRLARVHAEQREEKRKDRTKRLEQVGELLDAVGLLWANDAWLATQFASLAALRNGSEWEQHEANSVQSISEILLAQDGKNT